MFETPAPEPAIPPICAECAHLLGRRINLEAAKAWQCAAPQNIADLGRDPVTGGAIYRFHHQTCYDTREAVEACGPSGLWFKLYEYPQQNTASLQLGPRGKKPSASADSLLAELDNI